MVVWKRILLALVVVLALPTPAFAHGSVGYADEVVGAGLGVLIVIGVFWLTREARREDAEHVAKRAKRAQAAEPGDDDTDDDTDDDADVDSDASQEGIGTPGGQGDRFQS